MRACLVLGFWVAICAGGCMSPLVIGKRASGDAKYMEPAGAEEAATSGGVPLPELEGKLVDAGRADDRRVIYSGRFSLAVGDAVKAMERTLALAEELGGYMQKMTSDEIVIRVPAERFGKAVSRLESLGTVYEREVTAQDVTEEYMDLELRLRNARAAVDRLRELLAKAETVEETLAVQRELDRVTLEAEKWTARLKRLRSQVAFATLAARFRTLREAPPELKVRLPFAWLDTLGVDRLLRFD